METKTIIDLRGAGDRASDEEREARALGLRSINFPMSSLFAPRDDEVKRFLDTVNDSAYWPVFVHCRRSADRTGVMTAICRISRDGWTAERYDQRACTSRPIHLKTTARAPLHREFDSLTECDAAIQRDRGRCAGPRRLR